MKTIIRSELSAQGINKNPNPMLVKLLSNLKQHKHNGSLGTIVDQGCGQLRHVSLFLKVSTKLVLVDTEYQLGIPHEFNGHKLTIPDYINKRWPLENITLLDSNEFAKSRVQADFVFSINVLDVTTRQTRHDIATDAKRNLSTHGFYVIIIPRNDTWTLRICNQSNKFTDGHIFPHKRGFTYYRNWSNPAISKWVNDHGLIIVNDYSNYKHVVLFCRRG